MLIKVCQVIVLLKHLTVNSQTHLELALNLQSLIKCVFLFPYLLGGKRQGNPVTLWC